MNDLRHTNSPATAQRILPPTLAGRDDLEWFEPIKGERVAILVGSSESGGAYAIMDAVAAPGTATPLHSHREDEILLVREGVVTCRVGDKTFDAPAGTTVVIRAGTPHCTKNRTKAPMRYLTLFSPGGIEQFFRQIAGRDVREIPMIGADYGTIILGPPME